MYLKHHSRSTNSPSAEVVLYHLPRYMRGRTPKHTRRISRKRDVCVNARVCREGACKKTHVLKLNTTGKFALNIVDNLVVVHHQSSQVRCACVGACAGSPTQAA